ncbi:hypothetical protein [Prochlorococcus marinus]|uniref:hypothetical protein n=1 Tax=Prochlorococcus marinus TaxID=1219 RepID=UPI0022B5D00C|nr:hypothetical protein [Prochlorococcus marinus]
MLFSWLLKENNLMTGLNLCHLLENYCYSKKLSEKELDFLERCWFDSLNRVHYNRFPGMAPAIVCDEAGVARGSYWIICNAAILDKIRPIESSKNRIDRIVDILSQSGLIAA